MKSSLLFLVLIFVVSGCKLRPDRHSVGTPIKAWSQQGQAAMIAELEPTDTYLSIGPFLQKELDASGNDDKVVKVYALMRQEASLNKNYGILRAGIDGLPQSALDAISEAEKAKVSTVEFEVPVGKLKPVIQKLNVAVGAIELSLNEFKE